MLTEDKVTEIFCIADDFCKQFDEEITKHSLKSPSVEFIVHSRHRSIHNFLINLLAAWGAYCFFGNKPNVNFDFELPVSDGQLTIWQ